MPDLPRVRGELANSETGIKGGELANSETGKGGKAGPGPRESSAQSYLRYPQGEERPLCAELSPFS